MTNDNKPKKWQTWSLFNTMSGWRVAQDTSGGDVHVIERAALTQAEALIKDARGIVRRQDEQILAMHSEAAAEIARLNAQLTDCNKVINNLHKQIQQAERLFVEARAKCLEHTQELTARGTMIDDLALEIETLKKELRFDVDTNSATGWMIKYQRALKQNEEQTKEICFLLDTMSACNRANGKALKEQAKEIEKLKQTEALHIKTLTEFGEESVGNDEIIVVLENALDLIGSNFSKDYRHTANEALAKLSEFRNKK